MTESNGLSRSDVSHDNAERLVEFLRDNDAPCPLCGYNLRHLTVPVCPECRQPLELTVGLRHANFGWFIVTIMPGVFSGMAALFLIAMLVFIMVTEGGLPPPLIVGVALFGLTSGVATLVLIARRRRFLRMLPSVQRTWGVVAWGIHVGVFLALVGVVMMLN